jgi:hypothetical protein
MTVKVFNPILPFSIDGFVKLLPDGCALLFCSRIVGIDIRNKNGERLSSASEGRRAFGPLTRTGQHDVCVAKVHLNSTYRVAIAIVLGEAEDSGEPLAGIRYAAINEMRKKDAGGHGAVLHSDSMQRVGCGGFLNLCIQRVPNSRRLENRSTSWGCEILATLETPCSVKRKTEKAGRRFYER